MKTFFIGVDISKEWLDVSICDGETRQILLSFQVDNTFTGIELLIKKCKKQTKKSKLWFCFEHTGNFGLLLAHQLDFHELCYSSVPALEIKQSIGMSRGKNDLIDSIRIAQYAAVHQHKLKLCKLPAAQLLKIKSSLTYRDLLVKISTQLQNSRKSYLVTNKTIDVSPLIKGIEARICQIKKEISALEATIEKAILSCSEMKKKYCQAKSVRGIGIITAAHLIVCTNNFLAFENARKFNCYAGIAPFEHKSGNSILHKSRTSKLRNRNLKKLLFNGANSAIMHDPELRTYYNRKIEQGKAHLTVINAVACKIVARVFAVVNREEPFVNFY